MKTISVNQNIIIHDKFYRKGEVVIVEDDFPQEAIKNVIADSKVYEAKIEEIKQVVEDTPTATEIVAAVDVKPPVVIEPIDVIKPVDVIKPK